MSKPRPIWVIEVRDRNTTRPSGWAEWHLLTSHLLRTAFVDRREASDEVRDRNSFKPTCTQYRVAKYVRQL